MENDVYDYIFDEFLQMCPEARGNVILWRPYEEMSIIAEMQDGSAYLYDYVNKTSRRSLSADALCRKPINEEEWRRAFAKRLYRKMRIRGLTQDELAWRADISTSSITKYVNGDATPTVYKLIRIADILDCSVNDLVYF